MLFILTTVISLTATYIIPGGSPPAADHSHDGLLGMQDARQKLWFKETIARASNCIKTTLCIPWGKLVLNLLAEYLSSCKMSKNECVLFNLIGITNISHFGSFHCNTIARINVNVHFCNLQIDLPFLRSLSCSCFIFNAMAVLTPG